mgnify:CR=1 FL=1
MEVDFQLRIVVSPNFDQYISNLYKTMLYDESHVNRTKVLDLIVVLNSLLFLVRRLWKYKKSPFTEKSSACPTCPVSQCPLVSGGSCSVSRQRLIIAHETYEIRRNARVQKLPTWCVSDLPVYGETVFSRAGGSSRRSAGKIGCIP